MTFCKLGETMIRSVGYFCLMLVAVMFLGERAFANDQIELGKVNWNRDLEKAQAVSLKTGKPMFVQFQEVPG